MTPEARKAATRAALDKIAAALGVPVELFLTPHGRRASEEVGLEFLSDPQGLRVARAFLDVEDPAGRRAIADAVVGIAGSFNLRKAAAS